MTTITNARDAAVASLAATLADGNATIRDALAEAFDLGRASAPPAVPAAAPEGVRVWSTAAATPVPGVRAWFRRGEGDLAHDVDDLVGHDVVVVLVQREYPAINGVRRPGSAWTVARVVLACARPGGVLHPVDELPGFLGVYPAELGAADVAPLVELAEGPA